MYKTISKLCRSRIIPVLVVLIVGVLSARADVIPGPSLTQFDSRWVYSGVGFTATVDSTLTSFTFQNQGQTDTVELVDPLGNILDAVAIPSGVTSDTVSVSWNLTAGRQYYLLQSTASNSKFDGWDLPTPFDTQIALTDTGIFSFYPDSADFLFSAAAGDGTVYWAAFNDITTTSGTSVPEPASSTLLLVSGVFGLAAIFRRRLRKE